MRQYLLGLYHFWRKFFRYGGFKKWGFLWMFTRQGRADVARKAENRRTNVSHRRRYKSSYRKKKYRIKQSLIRRDRGFCNSCRKKFNHDELTIDHVKRIRDGGNNKLSNLQLLCSDCHKLKDYELKVEPSSFVNNPFADAFERASIDK